MSNLKHYQQKVCHTNHGLLLKLHHKQRRLGRTFWRFYGGGYQSPATQTHCLQILPLRSHYCRLAQARTWKRASGRGGTQPSDGASLRCTASRTRGRTASPSAPSWPQGTARTADAGGPPAHAPAAGSLRRLAPLRHCHPACVNRLGITFLSSHYTGDRVSLP